MPSCSSPKPRSTWRISVRPSRGQADRAPLAQEQRRAQRLLQAADGVAHRAGREAEVVRGGAEGAGARRRLEGPERREGEAEGHGRMMSRTHRPAQISCLVPSECRAADTAPKARQGRQPEENGTVPNVDPRLMANAIRFLSMDAIERVGEGHPGTPLGAADITTALFTRHLKFNSAGPALVRPRPLRGVERPRLHAALRAAPPQRLREDQPSTRSSASASSARTAKGIPNTTRPAASR